MTSRSQSSKRARRMAGWRMAALFAVIGAGLTTCATPTPYQPASNNGGYSEQLIENGRYKVTFEGNSLTKRETVENYLLYRAAELTLQSGNDYFIVAERDVDEKTSYRSSPSSYSHGYLFYSIYYHHGFAPYYPYYGYGPGFGYDYYSRPITKYTASADIVVYKGEKPKDNPLAYDARDVMAHLGPTIQRPAQDGGVPPAGQSTPGGEVPPAGEAS